MKGVWWCAVCQVPLVTQRCDLCGSVHKKQFARDLSPVFSAEMRVLRDALGLQQLPKRAHDFYLWKNDSTYYRLGKKVASITFDGPGRPRLVPGDETALRIRPKVATRLAALPRRLYQANRSAFDDKGYAADRFVREVVATFCKHTPVVSFSGGKDSSVVSHLVRRAAGNARVLHVFSDTTIEAKDTYDYLETWFSGIGQIPFIRLQPSVDFLDMCRKIGPPSRIHRWCCTSHKTAPMGVFIDLVSLSAGTLTFDGIRRCESLRRSRYRKITKDHRKLARQVSVSPLLDWSDLDVWAYILHHGIPINAAYRKGFRRIGCLYCPYVTNLADYFASLWYPTEFARWRGFLISYATDAGLPDPVAFAEDSWKGRSRGEELDKTTAVLETEECFREPTTFTYKLSRHVESALWEYLRPFGELSVAYDDGLLARVDLWAPKRQRVLAHIKVTRPHNSLRVAFPEAKWARLFRQRFQKQLKKYQSCVLCGACASACPEGAIVTNGTFSVNTGKCTHCLKCVMHDCIVVRALGH